MTDTGIEILPVFETGHVSMEVLSLLYNIPSALEKFGLSTSTSNNPVLFKNALDSIVMTDDGIFTETKPVQELNALDSIVCNDSGKMTVVNPLQSVNALNLILVTKDGIVIEVKPLQ